MADPGTEAEPDPFPAAARPAEAPPAPPVVRGLPPAMVRRRRVAGLTVWAVLVPEALAYASIAGVSPVVGLYAAPPALIFYAAFGSSRHLVVGPMSATAALSAAAVADLVDRRPGERSPRSPPCSRITTGVVGARRRPAAARVPRQLHLRAGAEGLHHRPRADDHHRPGAEAVRHRARARATSSSSSWDVAHATSATRSGGRWSSASARSRSSSGCGAFAPRGPRRRWSPSCSAIGRRQGLRPGQPRRRDRRPHRQRAARRSGCPHGLERAGLPRAVGVGRRRSCSSGSPRASARRRPTPRATTTRSTPTASCSASAPPTSAPGCRSGMVVNGSLSKTAVNGSARGRSAAVRAGRRRR